MPYRLDIPGQVSELQLRAIEAVATLVPEGGSVVEVGSLFGRSSWAWAQSVPQTATLLCVDPWSGNEGAHQVGSEEGVRYGYEAFARYTADCPNIVPLRAFSPDGVAWNRPIDCYYEDAVHTDPVLSRNVEFWSGFLRPTGILCGDDYRPRFPDVRAAAERMARELGRQLIVVDFFWCLLPNEELVPAATLVAEKLRQIGVEAAAKWAATPAVVRLTPLVPAPTRIIAGRSHRILLRVTNEGGQAWQERAAGELALRVKITGAASGGTRNLSMPIGQEQLGPDEAVPIDFMIDADDTNGVMLQIDCVLMVGDEASAVATWNHQILVDATSDAFATNQATASGIKFDDGWAGAGDPVRWSIGFHSRLTVDVPAKEGSIGRYLNLSLRPFVSGQRRTQRLIVEIAGQTVFAGCYSGRFGLSLPVDGAVEQSVTIDLRHPDAHRPADADQANPDRRTLGFALEAITWSAERPAPTI